MLKNIFKTQSYMPGPSMSAYIVEKLPSFNTTLMPSGGDSSRFFNSLTSCFITFGERFSLVAWNSKKKHKDTRQNWNNHANFIAINCKHIISIKMAVGMALLNWLISYPIVQINWLISWLEFTATIIFIARVQLYLFHCYAIAL